MWWVNCPTKAMDNLEEALAIYKLVIFFSKSCKPVVGWNDVITNEEYVLAFREFLQVIKESYKSLKEWPRMLIPETYWIKRIVCHTDGSLTACSFLFFLLS